MTDTPKNVEMTSLASDHPETKFGLPAARYDKWAKDAQKRKDNHPFEERRIGWILPKPNYKVVCCGQSWGDLFFILFLMLVFYGVNALIVVILWNITSLDFVMVSYIYGIIGILGLICLLSVVAYNAKSVDNRRLEELADGICLVCATNKKKRKIPIPSTELAS